MIGWFTKNVENFYGESEKDLESIMGINTKMMFLEGSRKAVIQ
jgi:hypothetical protein